MKLTFPRVEPDELAESCSLDVADRGAISQEAIGAALNLTRARVFQISTRAMAAVRREMRRIEAQPTMHIKGRAVRRVGELLAEVEPAKTGPKELGVVAHTQSQGRASAGKAAGLSKHQQVQALRVAAVPEPLFERETLKDKPATVTQLARAGTKASTAHPQTEGELPMAVSATMNGAASQSTIPLDVRVLTAVRAAAAPMGVREVAAAVHEPDLAHVKGALAKGKKAGVLRLEGRGPSARWTAGPSPAASPKASGGVATTRKPARTPHAARMPTADVLALLQMRASLVQGQLAAIDRVLAGAM